MKGDLTRESEKQYPNENRHFDCGGGVILTIYD
jgi:hypothetical protein